MSKELSENSKVEVSLKTLGGIGVLIATLVGMWFQLNASIEEEALNKIDVRHVKKSVINSTIFSEKRSCK